MLFSSAIAAVALLSAQAAAHGAVTSYVIDGKSYPGYEGFAPATSPKTIQRQWPDYNPTMTVTDRKVMCNGGTSADLSAPVKAGGKVRANWKQWTHEQGPVMVWMYKCAGDFKSCDGSGKKWFKIDEEGMTAPPLSGRNWGTAKVLKNLYWESTIPSSLAPGNYLIRHELLALHQAKTPQFYAECAQLEVSGSGSAQPGGEYLANIPGYAPQSDPGITVDTYSNAITEYTTPGPRVWKG
ncbi:lytic polysaccharide monooxygenase [Aaosphaeria arxii CBS 175.79]|uniref:AA9 family lytic polysaccharide monooxygenase n=1 Tax=Aaosphaeria arxii CBS 175.79 TaxID=1450172 RepID=A0A6A5XFU1_9PLEO|nr:lytic polysaccharide monooxygenase [Aaosphaeria arxii CBS 175.79]KAF2011244.1 lytic polysaccharide monooxygenase [Aaosphaeria arxii CBS 175.79]